VTHDADEFLASADHVLVLRDGSAAFSGTVHELLAAADDLEAQGDWTPPETVRAQLLARARGRLAGPPVLDTEAAAIAMAGAAR
jgi:ABC-type multidrug transport system ATPase subunit